MPLTSAPCVDVVVLCYNYAHYLQGCVASVLQQEGVNFRILIIDDCSKDNSEEVGRALAAQDERITFHRNEQNKGLVGSANLGLMEWASSKYCMLLSADDALTAGALARAVSVLEANPEVGMAYGLAQVFTHDAEMETFEAADPVEYRLLTGADFLERCCRHWCGVASPTAVVRTQVQHQVGGLDPRLTATCDMEIWMRMATVSNIAAINAVQAYYRRHPMNMSAAYTNRPLSDLQEQYDTAHAVLDVYGTHLPQAQTWLGAMHQRLLNESAWLWGMAYERGNKNGMAICQTFARSLSARWWAHPAWVRQLMKQAVGRRMLKALRRVTGHAGHDAPHNPFEVGAKFGWIPDAGLSSIRTIGAARQDNVIRLDSSSSWPGGGNRASA